MNVVRRSMLGALLLASAAHADRQVIAPGTGLQSAVEVRAATICRQRSWGRGRPSRTRFAAARTGSPTPRPPATTGS